MRQRWVKQQEKAGLIADATILTLQIRQIGQSLKQWLCQVAIAPQRHHVQYRLMLLLGGLLAVLLGWSAFCSAVFHLVLALCAGQW